MEANTTVLTAREHEAKDGLIPMNASTVIKDLTLHALDDTMPNAANQEWHSMPSRTALDGRLYQLHGYHVLDTDDQPVGIVDWTWSDETTDGGDVIGIQLRWLRGTARVVPVGGAQIDRQNSAIRVAYRKERIKQAPRCFIDRALTAEQRRSIRSHYSPSLVIVPSRAAEGLPA
jgi:hypothetical protein